MNEKPLEDWKQIPIGDLGMFFGGLTGKTTKDFGEGSAFLTYMQVYLQKTSQKEVVDFVVIDGHEKQNKVVYGDILFTASSETPDEIGMTDVFLESDWSPYLNSFCFGLRVRDNSLLYPPFTKYLLRGNKFREKIRPLAQGSTRFNLSKGNLAKISLLFPPLTEQKKIASILTSVDEVIESTQKQIDKLQDLKKATMNELLTKGIGHTEFKDSELGRIPKSWKVQRMSSIAKITDSLHETPIFSNFGIPMVRVKDIKRGNLSFENAKTVNEENYRKFIKKYKPKLGDIVMSRVGSYGISSYVSSDMPFCMGQNTVIISPLDIGGRFLYECLGSNCIQRQIELEVAGSGYKSLSLADIRSLKIRVPPKHEQEQIGDLLLSIDRQVTYKKQKLSQTQSLKKSLMQNLLTGKVRVQVN